MRRMLPGRHLQPLCLCCILVIQGLVQGPIISRVQSYLPGYLLCETVMASSDWSSAPRTGLWLADGAACYLCFEGAITQCDREQVCIYFSFYWDTRDWDGRHASKYIWVRGQVCREQRVMSGDVMQRIGVKTIYSNFAILTLTSLSPK